MGILSSKDTRRVSFDNTLALSSALNIQKTLECDNGADLLDLADKEPDDELVFHSIRNNKATEQLKEEGDGDYWAHRIEYLKKEHQKINTILESEYERTVEEQSNKSFDSPRITNEKLLKIKPCIDARVKVI
ncbi:unnamed protein product [Diatraea saccharalis]|uniref:Uncharacterized protein n=1 Tax=Diatraea saccharalis TaxID=40085 RepID=A0A9N9RF72_9NEOP|nr:unnamed protein product [Diatraea saccharalis]